MRIFGHYCSCFISKAALSFQAFYCFAWWVKSWGFPQSFVKRRLLQHSVKLAAASPMLPATLYDSTLFYILLRSSGTAVRDCKCTAIIHGYFTPSIILSAISSRNFKRDLAYSACLFPSRTRLSFPVVKYSHRIAIGKIQIIYHFNSLYEGVFASMHNFIAIFPEGEYSWTLNCVPKCLFYSWISFYDSSIKNYLGISSQFPVIYFHMLTIFI